MPAPVHTPPPPTTPAPEDDALDRLAALPGHDLARGLQLLGGRQQAYLKVLRSFVAYHGPYADRLHQLLQAGDLGAARALAHELRGAAANLGADAVAQPSTRLEQMLRAGPAQGPASPAMAAEVSTIRDALADLGGALFGPGQVAAV